MPSKVINSKSLWYKHLSEDKKESIRAKRRAEYANLNGEAKEKYLEPRRKRARESRENATEEELERRRLRATEFYRNHKQLWRQRQLEALGMTEDEYLKMYAVQSGACSICNQPAPLLCIDHDHSSGLIRGLLCKQCNLGLGNFRDTPDFLAAARDYLLKHRS